MIFPIKGFLVVLAVLTFTYSAKAKDPAPAESPQFAEGQSMGVDTLFEEPPADNPEPQTPAQGQVTGKKTLVKKLGRRVLTQCPEDMEYIIMDYNPKAVYEICIDRYEYPNQVGEMPKVGTTWYKAKQLCEGKGKYLCWDREWTKACVGLNNWDFGYYNIYDSSKCNVSSDGYKKIGDNADCKTKNYDVYDLVGNVREWTGGGGIGVSGGSFKDGRAARCSKWEALSLKRGYDDVGFRCCVRVYTGRYGKVSQELLKQGKTGQPAPAEEPQVPDNPDAPNP